MLFRSASDCTFTHANVHLGDSIGAFAGSKVHTARVLAVFAPEIDRPITQASAKGLRFADQAQLEQRLKAANKRLATDYATILRSSTPAGVAVEVGQGDFHAGLFTYLLTQYLWQAIPPTQIVVALSRVAEQIAPLMGEEQQIQWDEGGKHSLFAYSLLPETSPGAEGVIANLQGQEAEIHLLGLPLHLLSAYGLNSCFQAVSGELESPLLQIYSRQGLVAKARLLAAREGLPPLQVGQPVQEVIRLLLHNLGLVVALDSQLERIERVDATSALAGISSVTVEIGRAHV